MGLKELREACGLSRKELAERSGVNLRSLQDYEQGHKCIASMKGETLYRLSISLGCRMEDILNPGRLNAGIDRKIYSEKYKIYGQWEQAENGHNLLFMYQGEIVRIFTSARFDEKTSPWLDALAVLKIEDYVEEKQFEQFFQEKGEAGHEF